MQSYSVEMLLINRYYYFYHYYYYCYQNLGPGPCACTFGFHSYAIYNTETFTRVKEHTTLRTRQSSSFKMQPQSNDYSYFLTSESNLESLAEDYFSTGQQTSKMSKRTTTILTSAAMKLTPMLTWTFPSVIHLSYQEKKF